MYLLLGWEASFRGYVLEVGYQLFNDVPFQRTFRLTMKINFEIKVIRP